MIPDDAIHHRQLSPFLPAPAPVPTTTKSSRRSLSDVIRSRRSLFTSSPSSLSSASSSSISPLMILLPMIWRSFMDSSIRRSSWIRLTSKRLDELIISSKEAKHSRFEASGICKKKYKETLRNPALTENSAVCCNPPFSVLSLCSELARERSAPSKSGTCTHVVDKLCYFKFLLFNLFVILI